MSTEPTSSPFPPPPPSAGVDPYAAPTATVADLAEAPAASRFYVVSSLKFWSLYAATFGLYGFYWVYRQWADVKRATKGDEWPVMRAIFAVFFIHPLTAEIDQVLTRAQIRRDWHPQLLATLLVVAIIAGRVLDRLADPNEFGVLDGISVALLPVVGALQWRIQLAANAACEDPEGTRNARFTVANFVWIGLGGLMWLLLGLSLVALATLGPGV
jgi:hypothetical protein